MESASPLVVLNGPYEFLPSAPGTPWGSAEAAKALGAAYGHMPCDLGYAMPAEAKWLAENGAALPSAYRVGTARPEGTVLKAGAVRVGVLLFPALAENTVKAPLEEAKAVADLALDLRRRSDIVVGISPWGAAAEADFLDAFGHTVDLLFGAGPGPGFPARPMAGDTVLWMRPYNQGKTLLQVDVKTLPRRTPDWKWIRDKNAAIQLQSLNESITSDPDMATLLAGFHVEQNAN